MMCGAGVVISVEMGASCGVRVARVVLRNSLCGRDVRACLVRVIDWVECVLCGVNSFACGFSEDLTLVGIGPSPVMQPRTVGCVYLCAGCVNLKKPSLSVQDGSTVDVCANNRKSRYKDRLSNDA